MPCNKQDDEKIRCENCIHFSWGVCDLCGFRYDHDWTCKDFKRKETDLTE